MTAFIASIRDALLRADAKRLLTLFNTTTGVKPKMWGPSIIGYGSYIYHRSNGDEGAYFATGFAPRKSGLVIYIMPGYADYGSLLAKLGPHRTGKGCLYLKSLEGIDLKVLSRIITKGIKDLKMDHTVTI